MLGRAGLATVGETHPDPLAMSAHYLAAPEPGPGRVDVELLRSGRTTTQLRARLGTARGPCVEALMTCGRLRDDEPWWSDVPPPALAAEAGCVQLSVEAPGFQVPLMAVVTERVDPVGLGWTVGQPGGSGELLAWVRAADGRRPDPLWLLLAVDCLPPATFDLGSSGWVPTLELTCYLRAVPAPGPLRVRQRARVVSGGRVDEQCDVWDSRDRLVATGHQLAALRQPREPPVSLRTAPDRA